MDSENSKIIKEGMLKKWTNFMNGFQKRYFVLYNDMLCYYTSKDRSGDLKKIHLKCATITPNRDDTIKINTGTHNFKLKFNSIAEKVEWTNALRVTQAKHEDELADTLTSQNEKFSNTFTGRNKLIDKGIENIKVDSDEGVSLFILV